MARSGQIRMVIPGDGPPPGWRTVDCAVAGAAANVKLAMLTFPPEVLTILVLVALALAVFGLFVMVGSRPRKAARQVSDSREAVELLAEHDRAIAQIRQAVRGVEGEQRRQAEALLSVVQQVGLIRYDAFEDMGGHLSFSAALLDAAGNGVVITSINGRQDTRCYAKPVRGGGSDHNLSVEEEQAIREALATSREPASTGDGPRVRPTA
jgi:uncharacterized protein YlxW (UPF0749 family)